MMIKATDFRCYDSGIRLDSKNRAAILMTIKQFGRFSGLALSLMILSAGLLRTPALEDYALANETYKEKPDALALYLESLAHDFECEGCPDRYRRIDSNGRYSYSCLQFQEATFVEQARKYRIEIRSPDAIYSCETQKLVARAMFEDNPRAAARHWYTSIYVRGLGLPNI